MDPTTNLSEQRALTRKLLDGIYKGNYKSLSEYEEDVDLLCELVEGLDGWMSKGGGKPSQWTSAGHP